MLEVPDELLLEFRALHDFREFAVLPLLVVILKVDLEFVFDKEIVKLDLANFLIVLDSSLLPRSAFPELIKV